jgi:radical SAM superfamily enzyme YgiQ (UPF0313 family)
MYKMKKFRVRDIDEVKKDIQMAKSLYPDVKRVFLADGNALAAETNYLLKIAECLKSVFNVERISCYATPMDILNKDEDELRKIREAGMKLLYVGIESGDDEILRRIRKGVGAEEIKEACLKVMKCGFDLSVTVLTGIEGLERARENAVNTAALLNEVEPKYTAVLTYMPVPNTPLYVKIKRGEFLLPDAIQNLIELRWLVEKLKAKTIFRCNHASNYLPLKGTLPKDRERILKTIDYAIEHPEILRPERMRGL